MTFSLLPTNAKLCRTLFNPSLRNVFYLRDNYVGLVWIIDRDARGDQGMLYKMMALIWEGIEYALPPFEVSSWDLGRPTGGLVDEEKGMDVE